jgi:hypothetical protein
MTKRSLLAATAITAASVAVLVGCTSTGSTTSGPTSAPASSSPSTPTAVNTPATPQEAAAAAKNDNKCVNNVAWMTFENGKPASRTLDGTCESVIVFGNNGRLTLDKAGSITVMGNGNTVTVNSVGKIDFEGTKNTITYGGTKPAVLEPGTGNNLVTR